MAWLATLIISIICLFLKYIFLALDLSYVIRLLVHAKCQQMDSAEKMNFFIPGWKISMDQISWCFL